MLLSRARLFNTNADRPASVQRVQVVSPVQDSTLTSFLSSDRNLHEFSPEEDQKISADIFRLNGQDLRGLPIEDRKERVVALVKKPPIAMRMSTSFTEKIAELLETTYRSTGKVRF